MRLVIIFISLELVLAWNLTFCLCFRFTSNKLMFKKLHDANRITTLRMNLEGTPFESLYTMIKAREYCPPQVCIEQLVVSLIRSLHIPDYILHWFHPIIMLLSILSLGSYGIYQGFVIKSASSNNSLKDERVIFAARNQHPTIMAALGFIMVLGSQSGLASLLVQERSILESPHSASALLVLTMFIFQGFLSFGISLNPIFRSFHTYFGGFTILAIVYHIITGLQLGFSY